ncbi:MAG: DUF2784 domain-containing protein [Rhodospirillales bacterium]|nr:DUF2784 domain-containing protein [Rhodospirillales bacterium]
MDYGLWADVIGVVHACIVIFIVGGQALILAGWGLHWVWTRGRVFRYAHLSAIGFVVLQQWLGRFCPLTLWESDLRQKAGAEGMEQGFIAYWLERLLYYSFPSWVFTVAYTTFALLVFATFVLYRPGNRNGDET